MVGFRRGTFLIIFFFGRVTLYENDFRESLFELVQISSLQMIPL